MFTSVVLDITCNAFSMLAPFMFNLSHLPAAMQIWKDVMIHCDTNEEQVLVLYDFLVV